MYYKELSLPGTNRNSIETFLGYNHNHSIADGEFYDMKNMSGDEYPALSPRKKRRSVMTLQEEEWEEQDIEITSSCYDEDGKQAVYQSGRIYTNDKEEIQVSYNLNNALIEYAELKVVFYTNGAYHSEYSVESEEGIVESTSVPSDVTEYQVIITANPVSEEEYTEEHLQISITDITVRTLSWNIRGMLLKDDKLAYMVKNKLYYDGEVFDFAKFMNKNADDRTKQQLISFGAYILIFPEGLYLHTHTKEYGALGAEYIAGEHETSISFVLSDASGNEITTTSTKPDNPQNGACWLDTSSEPAALYKWNAALSMWVGVSSTYIRIEMNFNSASENPFPKMFKEGDAIYMNTGIEAIDNGSIIVKCGNTGDGDVRGGYILVKGILKNKITKTVSQDNPIWFRRKIPKLDYVCVSYNRVWGCYHGMVDDDMVNEIYACKLGDPKNWYVYAGASTDSYALTLGDDGEFTGAFTYQGYPMFFKENIVYKIYGAYPAAYQLATYNCRGVQKGCERSLAVVNEYLMYKSIQDVCVFDGSTPSSVSKPLGNKKYVQAVAGACMGKYYLSMKDENNESVLFVFDIDKNIWHKEDDLRIEEFVYNNNGELYGRSDLSIYGFENAKNILEQMDTKDEEKVHWYAETGEMGLEYLEKKYINAIQIRAVIPENSLVEVYIKNTGMNYEKMQAIRGSGKMEVYRIPIVMARNDSFRIRLEGYGECRIHALVKELERSSDRGCI